MRVIIDSLRRLFSGRRQVLLPLCAIVVLGTLLFLLFPARVRPAVATGGGDLRRPASAATAAPNGLVQRFLTLNPGETVDLSPGPVSFTGHPALLRRVGGTWKYRAVTSGHTLLTTGAAKAKRLVYVFVSPMPTRQVSREDLDWYKTQYGTGIANCGPAVVSMAILWARGQDVSVQGIRDEIGYPYDDGATSFDNLQDSLNRHKVVSRAPTLSSTGDLAGIVDRGHIAMVLIQSGGIGRTVGDPSTNLVGRYYDDDEGHYVLVKGYSLDRRYFVVYDPYPVDWDSNSLRYGDDVSMIGKNRFYSAQEMWTALKTRMVVEITRSR